MAKKQTTTESSCTLRDAKYQKALLISAEIMKLAGSTLLVNFRFLDAALSRLKLLPQKGLSYAVTGEVCFYDPATLIRDYAKEQNLPVRNYLHMLLHCVFRHMYLRTAVDEALWDLSCDIAVEALIGELHSQALSIGREAAQKPLLTELKTKVKYLTAEHLYRYFMTEPPSPSKLQALTRAFHADEHIFWHAAHESRTDANGDPASQDSDPAKADEKQLTKSMEQIWRDISERMQMELEAFQKGGDKAGSLRQSLALLNRERYDYADFLKRFAVKNEVMRVNDDEFDYIYYTYGLQLYENMPLIEPLEYKEVNKIREFVIAIDTSGSVSGELVQRFVQKTYNILKSTESFLSRIDLHILQCDAEIEEDARITTEEEFEQYINTMELKGFGGTDFRPVFSHVDALRANGELTHLKGLIYFTDGYGTFPDHMPDYSTCFVFLDDACRNPDVPSWAIRMVLESEDLGELP